MRAGLLAAAILSVITCTAETPRSTGTADQAVINPPLPNLTLILNARTTLTVGPSTTVFGDVGASGVNGQVVFESGAVQQFGGTVVANTVTVRTAASVWQIIANDIILDGSATLPLLGLDPAQLPSVPGLTASTPGTTNVSTGLNQTRQLCPGQYGTISVGQNSTLNLNGGVYQVNRLNLAAGARLMPSEPVVILVTGTMTTGSGARIAPHPQAINAMAARDIRIEVAGAATIGDNTQLRSHIVVPNGKFSTGTGVSIIGAAWARSIAIGPQNSLSPDGVVAAQTPIVPPPCNDNSACTVDQCVTSGTVAFCRNTPEPVGTSCEDGSVCNGAELCNSTGQCLAGTTAASGTSCPDGDACNGDEVCNGFGSCLGGTPPQVNDGNACTSDACDPATGVSHDPVPDGSTCSGTGTCEGGVCSVQAAVFSDDFLQFQSAPGQCDHWNSYLTNELSNRSYQRVTLSGTFDPTGVTCSDPSAATQICNALHDRTFLSAFCNGRTWNVGDCGGTEISVDSGFCNCTFGRTLRPCTGTAWGGLNSDTCGAQNQNITLVCE